MLDIYKLIYGALMAHYQVDRLEQLSDVPDGDYITMYMYGDIYFRISNRCIHPLPLNRNVETAVRLKSQEDHRKVAFLSKPTEKEND